MMAGDLLARLWALVLLYPAQAILLAVLLWVLFVLAVLAIMSMARPELQLHQWEDDDEQQRAVTRPAPLAPNVVWRTGRNWWVR